MNVIDTLRIYQALKEYLPSEAAQLIAQTFGYLYGEVSEGLKKKDLDEVRDSIAKLEEAQSNVVKHLEAIDQRLLQLAEAQIRTEQRVEELAVAQARTEARVEELAKAQARTEKRLEELAAAQARSEQRLEDLAAAQARTEKRLEELAAAQARTEQRLEELAAAQARTEQRLEDLAAAQARTEKRLEDLAAAQARTEQRLDSLTVQVQELAAAQTRTEKRLEKLAAAQARTEQRLEELAEAQARTEARVEELAKAQARTEEKLDETRKEVGGLSMAVGYGLEDRVIPYIPLFAKETYRMKVQVVDRRFILCDEGQYEEVNIYAEGTSDEGPCFLIGECKAQPGKKDADRFAKKIARLSTKLNGKIYPLFVGYLFSPEVEEYFRSTCPEIRIMKSFQFPLLYGERMGYF